MKKIIFSLIVSAYIILLSPANAQALKIGHLHMQALISAMPESDSAQTKLQKMTKELESNYQQMQVEFNKKYDDFNKNSKSYSELVRSTKEAELKDMNKRLQDFQTAAQQNLQEQNQKLLKPILDKANKAIADVALEGKFTYIFDSPPQGTIVYMSADAIDVLPMAKKKLGLK